MLVHMAMCEFLCGTSPLPSLEQQQTTPIYQMSLNSYITHPIRAGPGDHVVRIYDLQDLKRSPWEF